jgi:predicted transporter
MEQTLGKQIGSSGRWPRLALTGAIAVALPFVVGAVLLAQRLIDLPDTAGHLARAQVLGAGLFAFGIALGVVGAAFALTSRARHRRVLGTALTLFGVSHVLLGIYVPRAIEASATGSEPPLIPLIALLALWVYSAILAFRALGLAGKPVKAGEPEPSAQTSHSEQREESLHSG